MTSDGVVVLLYLNVFLAIGLVLRHFFKRISAFIPYTVLLLAIGAGLGVVARVLEDADLSELAAGSSSNASSSSSSGLHRQLAASGSGSGPKPWWTPRDDFKNAVRMLGEIDPHLMLYIFLPALLFESANAIDFHVFKKVILKTVTLAFPGMLLGSVMMACVVRLAYPSWSWDLALLLGTITSATDPVAVVAMLRELGAKVSLSTTIEGESLLNDGSAVVLFNVLKTIALAGGAVGDAGQIAADFFRMAVLGPIIGWIFGVLALVWISRVFNDPLVEISISIVIAYLAFYVSEYWIHSSGVLTVVFTGLAFSSTFGRTSVSPEVFHFLHEFWETLGYVANTIIFLITGVAIAYNAPSLIIEPRDIGISFLIYFAGIIIRMIIFIITFPLFTRMPYGWTWQEALISAWGGLRGAVGLALGLDIFLTQAILECPWDADPTIGEPNIACKSVQGRILLHTSMMVVGTLVINASTLKPLLFVLKFVELSHEELTMLAHVAERLKTDARKEMKRIQDDPFLSNSNWEIVRQFADLNELFRPLLKGMVNKKLSKKEAAETDEEARAAEAVVHDRTSRVSRIDVPQVLNRDSIEGMRQTYAPSEADGTNLLSELKYHYHMSLKAGIWHLQHQGTLGSSATDILTDALNHKLDDKHAVDWIKWSELQVAGGQESGFKLPNWLERLRALPFLGSIVDSMLSDRLTMWHDVAFGFLTVHEHLEHEVEHWTHDQKLLTTLHEVLHDNAEGARKSLIDLQEVLPEVCLSVNTKQAARLMLNATREKVQALEAQGALPEPQAKAMVSQVETQMRKLQLARMPLDFSKEKVLREVSWMQELSQEAFMLLVHESKEFFFSKGEYVVRQGDVPSGESESVFLVARGIVEIVEEYENGETAVVARRGSGVVIGEQSLLTGSPRAASARACTSVVVLGLSHSAMQSAMDTWPELANRMWHQVGLNLVQKLLGDEEEAQYGERPSTSEELKEAASQWVPNMEGVLAVEAGRTMPLERKVLLLHGSCIEYREGESMPTPRQLEELQLSVRRENGETIIAEQAGLRHAVKRDKTKVRRLSLHAAIFGAGEGHPGRVPGQSPGRVPSQPGDVIAQIATKAVSMMPTEMLGHVNAVAKASDAPPPAAALKPAELGRERRSLNQTSPWIVHIAPCLIDVPTGGTQAKHELCFLSPTSRLAVQPETNSMRDSLSGATGTTGEKLDGAPLQITHSPHELRPALQSSMLKKLTTVRYQPGDTIIDAKTGTTVVHFLLAGHVRCDVDPTPTWGDGKAADATGVFAAGEPFTKGADPTLFSPPAGSPLGEWLLLQSNLVHLPRVVAHTQVTCVTLSEDVLLAAMQQEEQLAANFWWARCQRETFCFLRKLEPFCWWQPSKLWRWLQYGRHVKVPEGKGQLGAHAPFVVLVQGKCHVSYNDNNRESAAARFSVDGQRRRLGSMKLLGSGARIADLLTFHSHHHKNKDMSSDELAGTSAGGKWVPGPDVVHCHEEIAYHFARDSLVFIPSERGLPWLPTNYVFASPGTNGSATTEASHSPFGIRVAATGSPTYSFEKRSGSPVTATEENALAA